MSAEVVTSPSVPEHRSRTWLVAAVALVVGLVVGAAVVAVTRTDSSTSSRASGPGVAAPVTAVNSICTGDAGALFAALPSVRRNTCGGVEAGGERAVEAQRSSRLPVSVEALVAEETP